MGEFRFAVVSGHLFVPFDQLLEIGEHLVQKAKDGDLNDVSGEEAIHISERLKESILKGIIVVENPSRNDLSKVRPQDQIEK